MDSDAERKERSKTCRKIKEDFSRKSKTRPVIILSDGTHGIGTRSLVIALSYFCMQEEERAACENDGQDEEAGRA